MIQRIQSLFLAVAAIAAVLMFFFPIADFYNEHIGNYKLLVTGLKGMDPDPKIHLSWWASSPLAFLTAGSLIISLITLFLYKKRPLQIKLLAFNILATIVLIIVIFLYYVNSIEKITGILPSYQFGAFCPLICLIFLLLANRFIRKDEALVKSADRLR
jgi:integral membrane sensor domain MASE1